MIKKLLVFGFVILLISKSTNGQVKTDKVKDTATISNLPEITLVGKNSKNDYQQMPAIVGTNIYAGKKNTLIVLDNVQANVVTNNMRQILAKVPGVHIWESDPSGTQIGIAARGLSPNRSWEFNVRQNGYDISADPFGYPEAYYNPQLQAVQRIEIVRGQASLQYGPQFGGMVNYILRNGSEINKPVEFETQQTLGSFNLFNSYNAVGGKKGKVNYYSFFDHRNGNGYRKNSNYYTNAGFATISYHFTPKVSLTAEVMQSHVRSQQPGGITDAQLKVDAAESYRSRNWFDIKWTTPALILNYKINTTTTWNTKLFGTIGDRNSVGFLQSILIRDTINKTTGNYNNRLVTIDNYRNYGLESRMITNYNLGKKKNVLSGGVRLYTGTTSRRADGKGTTGSDYDVTTLAVYPRDIQFKSKNVAVFAENMISIGKKIVLIPGIRYEWLVGASSGRNGYNTAGQEIILQNIKRSRSFVLAGFGAQYQATKSTEVYGNISQAYRPIQFANLQAPPTTDVVDENLKDAKGFNFDIGYRGKYKNYLQFDVSTFYLEYNNRIGTVTPIGATYRLITNVGASTSKGFEGYAEFSPIKAFVKNSKYNLVIFGTYGYTNAKYGSNHKDASTAGKKVENAPQNIFRGGISLGYKELLLTTQLSYVSATYSDANNTELPSANAQNGLIPSYVVSDFTASYKLVNGTKIKAGVNNIFDKKYFTRRAGGYPGPGVLPADGRSFFVSVGARF